MWERRGSSNAGASSSDLDVPISSRSDVRGVCVFSLLVLLLICVFLLAPITVSLDGYSHLYEATVAKRLAHGDPLLRSYFSFNSILVPNWFCSLALAGLSSILPGEWALKLFVILLAATLFYSLYFCTTFRRYDSHERPRVLIILLPFAVNGCLLLGFYNFLFSFSLSLFAFGLFLRHGFGMSGRLRLLTAIILLVAYTSHPLPVLVSLAFPCSYVIGEGILNARDRWRTLANSTRLLALYIWPWVLPVALVIWFAHGLTNQGEPSPLSLKTIVRVRAMELLKEEVLKVSPTPSVATPFLMLLGILLYGVTLRTRELDFMNKLRMTAFCVLSISMMVLYLIAPDRLGDGSEIQTRFLLYAVIAFLLAALTAEVLQKQLLTLSSVLATIVVIGFAAEYWLVSYRLAPAVQELNVAMSGIPKHSRILIMGYSVTPFCQAPPLVERTLPERHWALIGALRNDLIVLNDYQPATSIFPIRSNLPWTEKIFDEVAVNDKKQTAAWAEFLSRPQLDVDFIVAWGAPKGAANCANWDWIRAPLEEALKARHDLLLVREGTSRVALWHRRDGPIKF